MLYNYIASWIDYIRMDSLALNLFFAQSVDD